MLQLLSAVFWAFLTVSSIALFPVAVLIWAITAPFDDRRVLLHRFTCFWGSRRCAGSASANPGY